MSSRAEEDLVTGNAEGQEDSAAIPQSGGNGVEGSAEAESSVTLAEAEAAEPSPGDPVAVLEGEVAKWKDLALRSQAELDNFRKRMAREKADSIRFGNAALLETLLPVVDNFRFGLEAAKRDAGQSVVFEGMAMVYKQLHDVLEEFGVQEVPAEGLLFDPNLHDAVKEEDSDAVSEGHVLTVIRKGYRLHDRLLRPANVIVSRGPAQPDEAGSAQTENQAATEPSAAD